VLNAANLPRFGLRQFLLVELPPIERCSITASPLWRLLYTESGRECGRGTFRGRRVLWDMDGTSIDSEEFHWISWRETLAKDGIAIRHNDPTRWRHSAPVNHTAVT
jgi:hypothetical protein